MLEIIDIGPNVLGLKVLGKIQDEDMKKMIAVCEEKMQSFERIAIYVEVVEMKGSALMPCLPTLSSPCPT